MIILDAMEYATDAAAKAAWNPYLQETVTFVSRVVADGGTVIDRNAVDLAIRNAKSNSYYTAISGWYSSLFAYKDAGSGKVSKLYDLSPNNNDLISASGSEPVYTANQQNGLACIVTTGNKYLSKAAPLQTTQSYSMFGCFKLNSASGTQVPVTNGNTANSGYCLLIASNTRKIQHNGSGGTTLDNGSSDANFTLWEALCNNGSMTFHINAGTPTTKTNTPIVPATCFYLANDQNNNYAPGIYGEFLLLNAAASTAQRQAIETLLNTRWGIY